MINEKVDEIFLIAEEELSKAVAHQKNEYMVIRAGRANPHVLDKVMVDYYGQPTPIVQMGTVSVAEARILCINIWDQSQIKNVIKAICASDIGITPTDDGKTIRLVFPQLTEERRIQIAKDLKKIAEESKVAVRNARRDAIDALKNLKKDGTLSEDEQSVCEKDLQKLVDEKIVEIDKNYAEKEKEVMSI